MERKPKERKRRMPLLIPAGVGSMAEGMESCLWNNNHSYFSLLKSSPCSFTSARPSSSSPQPNLGTFMGDMHPQTLPLCLLLCLPALWWERKETGGCKGSGGGVKAVVLLGLSFAFAVWGKGENLAGSLAVALHTNMGHKKKTQGLFVWLSHPLTSGRVEKIAWNIHKIWSVLSSSGQPSILQHSQGNGQRRMESCPRQEIIVHNSMKLSQFVQ